METIILLPWWVKSLMDSGTDVTALANLLFFTAAIITGLVFTKLLIAVIKDIRDDN